jgi:carbonic anhydrase
MQMGRGWLTLPGGRLVSTGADGRYPLGRLINRKEPLMSLATLLDRNQAFAATDAVARNPKIPWLPNELSYIITCIDSRAEPAAFLGVGLGDATVQRTVGGRVTPAVLRDVAYISYLTETKTPDGPWWELAVIHHTDCGSTLLADEGLRHDFATRGGFDEADLAWLPAVDPAATVRTDVTTLVTAPQLSPSILVSGYVYHTAEGTLESIVGPTSVASHSR